LSSVGQTDGSECNTAL